MNGCNQQGVDAAAPRETNLLAAEYITQNLRWRAPEGTTSGSACRKRDEMSRVLQTALAIGIPIVILGGLGLGGASVIGALKPAPEEATEPPKALSVFASPTRRTNLQLAVEAQGEVRPFREISVASQISGRIEYVSPDFLDGGFIRRNQVLVRLESADFELAIVRARAGVASAEQALARELAEGEIARQDLAEEGITDASPLAMREPQLAEARAALDSARAQLAEAELALTRTQIRAPFDGRVRSKAVDIGQFVTPGQSLGQVFATDVVEVPLAIDDDELGRVGLPIAFAESSGDLGPEVVFTANVGGEPRTWRGRIARTAASVNTQTRLINIFGVVEDPYGDGADNGAPMAPGLFVSASIQGALVEDLVWAPRSALRGDDRLFIGDPEESVLRIRQVDVVYSDDKGAYLRGGAEPGELAVVSPIQAAFDGMRIEILERAEDGTIIPRNEDGDANLASRETSAGGPSEGAVQ